MKRRRVHQRKINSGAISMAQELVDLCENVLDPSERQVAFEAFYFVCRRGLESVCLEHEDIRKRLKPTCN